MKNKFHEMLEDPEFRKFYEELARSANYFVATSNHPQPGSVDICVAYAYHVGLLVGFNQGKGLGSSVREPS